MSEKTTARATVMVSYRFMTYDELAALLNTSWQRVHMIVRQNHWRWHEDHRGARRVSVPEAFVTESERPPQAGP